MAEWLEAWVDVWVDRVSILATGRYCLATLMSSDRTKQICLWMTIYIYIYNACYTIKHDKTNKLAFLYLTHLSLFYTIRSLPCFLLFFPPLFYTIPFISFLLSHSALSFTLKRPPPFPAFLLSFPLSLLYNTFLLYSSLFSFIRSTSFVPFLSLSLFLFYIIHFTTFHLSQDFSGGVMVNNLD